MAEAAREAKAAAHEAEAVAHEAAAGARAATMAVRAVVAMAVIEEAMAVKGGFSGRHMEGMTAARRAGPGARSWPTRASSSSSACEIGSRSGAISPLMGADCRGGPALHASAHHSARSLRGCSKPPNPKAAGHVWYDFFWDVIPHTNRHRKLVSGPWEWKFGP